MVETEIILERKEAGRSASADLSEAVRRVLLGANGYRELCGLVRVIVPVDGLEPLEWLRSQHASPRFYWHGRQTEEEAVAAVGAADVFLGTGASDLSELQQRMAAMLDSTATDARYYGGYRFGLGDVGTPSGNHLEGPAPLWFFLPRVELHADVKGQKVICNLVLPRDREKVGEVLAALSNIDRAEKVTQRDFPSLIAREDAPSREQWHLAVRSSLDLIADGELAKVVLARRADFRFAAEIDSFDLLSRLISVSPGCFHFLMQASDDGVSFVGASPERLFRRVGRRIESEAVAGTRPRGASVVDDERLRDELLLSPKDRREHVYVEKSIRESLASITEDLSVDARASAMTLQSGRHIFSGVRGMLREKTSDVELLRRLHPTAAVGGYPTERALAVIRELEPFDRGWYAGPIGWLSRDASEFAVAIRTGLLRGKVISLFSGAGIVAGSEPAAEWAEVEQKISDFTRVLGIDLERTQH